MDSRPVKAGTTTCEKHGEYDFYGREINGRVIANRACPKCVEESYLGKVGIEKSEEARRKSNIPKRFLGAELDSLSENLTEYAARWNEKSELGTSLIFSGATGTGKTHAACAIANSLIRQGFSVHYVGAWWAIEAVKQAFSDRSQLKKIREFANYPLLIIDEIGRQYGTESEKMILYQIINARYEAMRPTIAISNMDAKALAQYLGEACVDRFRENGGKLIIFDGKSRR